MMTVLLISNVDFFMDFLFVRFTSGLFYVFWVLFYFLGLTLLFASLMCIGDK